MVCKKDGMIGINICSHCACTAAQLLFIRWHECEVTVRMYMRKWRNFKQASSQFAALALIVSARVSLYGRFDFDDRSARKEGLTSKGRISVSQGFSTFLFQGVSSNLPPNVQSWKPSARRLHARRRWFPSAFITLPLSIRATCSATLAPLFPVHLALIPLRLTGSLSNIHGRRLCVQTSRCVSSHYCLTIMKLISF